jgi:hypothetical protein
MRLDPRTALGGNVATEAPLRLELTGAWPKRLTATIGGRPVAIERTGRRTIVLAVPAGEHRIVLRPAAAG